MNTAHHDVRQHILDTGKAIIIGKGYAAVGLNEILAAASVPKGSFYHYFKSKELFGVAMLDSYMDGYLVRMDELLNQSGGTAAQRLMAYWDSWFDTQPGACTECRCLVVKLAGEVADMSDAMRGALLHGTNQIVERLAGCIRAGQDDGSLPAPAEPQQLAQTLYQLWLGAALLTKLRRDASALDNARRTTLQLLHLSSPP